MYSGSITTQELKNLRENLFYLKGKTTGHISNNFIILNRNYNTQRYNLSKKTLFFLLLNALFLTIYFLFLYIFLFSFTCSHLRRSSRLHLILTTLWDSLLFPLCTNGRMVSPFNSSSFPSFLRFTLFTSSHNKYKPTYLDFASTHFFSSTLPLPNDLAFYFFLFFLPSACPTCLSQPTHADFVHNERKVKNHE